MQLFSYGLLFFWDDDWSKAESIVFVTFAVSCSCIFAPYSYERFLILNYHSANVWRHS